MRGKKAPKRKIKPDIRYNNVTVTKFMNYLMTGGKKSVAQKVLYDCFDIIQEKIDKKELDGNCKQAVDVFEQAIKNVSPQLEVRGRRVGGANYQVPYPVRGERRHSLAFRWIIASAKSKKGKAMSVRLAEELMDALNNTGTAMKKRADVQRMAEANRAFAHFAI